MVLRKLLKTLFYLLNEIVIEWFIKRKLPFLDADTKKKVKQYEERQRIKALAKRQF